MGWRTTKALPATAANKLIFLLDISPRRNEKDRLLSFFASQATNLINSFDGDVDDDDAEWPSISIVFVFVFCFVGW